jgi:3',5'-cyclic AMP phosphodiesterase CpdA
MIKIAVIADPHFHDVTRRADEPRHPLAAVRTLADTVASTRVFNESYPAFPSLLDDIVARGIELVVIVGDLTDDGQAVSMAAATALLDDYSRRHGLRFFATPGNHDLYAIHGRHQSKRFLNADGRHVLVTSDSGAAQGASVERIVTELMACGGYGTAIPAMADLGFFRRPDHLHWECPFGVDDALDARTFEIRSADGNTVRRMIDSSYLVEPVDGLWILSIDANVFEPRIGDGDPALERSYIDSTDAGWNAMPRNKPFLFTWMADVAARARAAGKHLLSFSHYPIIDPLNSTTAEKARLLGETSFVRRAPDPDVSAAAAVTGLGVHFSGHLHINDTARLATGNAWLVNVAVPSMVGYPPGYKIATFDEGRLDVETVTLLDVPGFDLAFSRYRREMAQTGQQDGGLTATTRYGDFLGAHLAQLVRWRYLPREWPGDLADLILRLDLGDLAPLADTAEALAPADVSATAGAATSGGAPAEWQAIPAFDMVVDWYRLRNGRHIALDDIPSDRLAAYRRLGARFLAGSWPEASVQAQLARFFRILEGYLASQPSRAFSIDLTSGAIVDRWQAGQSNPIS